MANMNNDWLKQLAPAHAPAAPGIWPLAPGWWILLTLLLIGLGALIYRARRQATRLSRAALQELKQLQNKPINDTQLAVELERLLRRYAIAAYGRETVANLSGAAWLEFVVSHGGTKLSGASGNSLIGAAYGSKVVAERDIWLRGAANFLRCRK